MKMKAISNSVREEDDNVVVCPVCQFEYTHLLAVTIDQNAKRLIIGGTGKDNPVIAEQDLLEGHGRRGSVLRLQFECENGHHFELSYEFLKGLTYFNAREGGAMVGFPSFGFWRD